METSTSNLSPSVQRLVIAIYASMAVAPFAAFFALRLRDNASTFFDPFGFPWPPVLATVVQVSCVVVVAGAVLLALLGLSRGGNARTAGVVSTVVGAISVVPIAFALFFFTFGDLA
jgi:hypothetical protein